jgi:two-component system, sensor histidine kinase and response regulator
MSFGEAVLFGLVLVESLALILTLRQRRRDKAVLAGVDARIEHEVGIRTAELQKSEAQFKQSEAKLRKIFEACPETISINSLLDGRYIDANTHLTSSGYTAAELNRAGKSKPIWVERAQLKEFARVVVEHDIVRNMEVQFRTKGGTVFPALISGAKIELDGEPCVVSFVSDISRLKRTQERLIDAKEAALAASRAKSEFLSSMSHEIRTPMNAILGMVDLLSETSLTPEQRKYLGTLTSNGDALLTLINGILDLARIESGRLSLEQTEFELEELIEHVAETLAVRAHEKKLELTTQTRAGTPGSIIGDPLRLRQVLINLIGNAIKFTEQGEVAIAVEAESFEADQVRLRFSVRDTGIGIAPDQLDAIFQSFTQADSSATRRYGGAGLGLTIASRLVEQMSGRWEVTSQLGRGSTFEFVAQF